MNIKIKIDCPEFPAPGPGGNQGDDYQWTKGSLLDINFPIIATT
jgi:hypothetical protein